jgi:PAS domain S-box-containing protein
MIQLLGIQSSIQKNGENQLNALDLLTLGSSILCISFGVMVYTFNRRALLNKVFLATSFFGFLYAFTEVMMWQSSNFASASLWSKMGSIWPFFIVLALHFALVFTGSKWLKNKFAYLLLYLPAVLFLIISLFTDLISAPPIMTYYGYEDFSSNTIVSSISTIWVAALPVLAFILCIRHYRATAEEHQRQQRKLVAIAFGIPVFTYLITNVVFPIAGIDTPNLGHFAILFFTVFVSYGIWKHELFTFDAAVAAENIVAMIPDSLILADMTGKILKVNKRLVKFSGFNKDELIGNSMTKLCTNEMQFTNDLKELAEKRVINNHELTLKTKFGEQKNVLFSGSVVKSKTGRDIGLTCIIHDISELKEMEHRLVKSERLASIGELAGQIGHDLRNPLQAIKNCAYFLIKKENGLTEPGKTMLETIDNAVKDSDRIISSLIDYASDLKLDVSPCTLKSLFSIALSKIEIPNRIEVIDHVLDETEISVDVNKFENVITRIIVNAIEAMPQKGTLELRSTQKDSNIEIAFIDSGVGIPENVLPKVFSPLVTTKAKGMGLGLAICKRIVEAHEGKITVESMEDKGTTFVITLPIKPRIELAVVNNWVITEDSSSIRET